MNDLLGTGPERMNMTGIVERLRVEGAYMHPTSEIINEAANEIERLREALKLCSGWVEAYGEPETKEKVRAALMVPNKQ